MQFAALPGDTDARAVLILSGHPASSKGDERWCGMSGDGVTCFPRVVWWCGGSVDVGSRADVCASCVHLLLFAPGGCVPPSQTCLPTFEVHFLFPLLCLMRLLGLAFWLRLPCLSFYPYLTAAGAHRSSLRFRCLFYLRFGVHLCMLEL
ncbi:hypothetical protein GSI_07108 [Ganoderma sinense ZZ0214-1]|uniref:Uncharacterized protein n=1 Tax=Ganoderma sinense ZZ0214-1 TaxID=1077348 RepID=A0A2G8SB01_9APHY|nr:hypothetical protein GSI_07108 [Ganoderma sinense ZZ0214-1]